MLDQKEADDATARTHLFHYPFPPYRRAPSQAVLGRWTDPTTTVPETAVRSGGSGEWRP